MDPRCEELTAESHQERVGKIYKSGERGDGGTSGQVRSQGGRWRTEPSGGQDENDDEGLEGERERER